MSPRTILTVVFIIIATMLTLEGRPALGGPETLNGELNIPSRVPVVGSKDNATTVRVDGVFRVNEKSGLDALAPASATLSVSKGEWEAALSVTYFSDVQEGDIYDFYVTIEVPSDAKEGDSSSYTVTLTLEDFRGSTQTGATFVVNIEKVLGEDNDDGDGFLGGSSGGSISLIWPLFILGLIVLTVIIIIWAKRNFELVREVGTKKVFIREKDSGRIIGRRRGRPPGGQ